MELNREHFRAIIFHNFRRGLSRQECFDELNSLYSDKAPSYSSVKNWYNEFNRGRCSIQDESRAGRLKSVVVPEKINAVRELIKQDRHVTYREIEASLDISMTSINKILHEHLSVKKICSRWIPHNLTNAQKKARVDWCKEMLEKYIQGTSKAVYNIYTGDESWIYAYEPETKQQSTVWVFQDEAKPTKVVRGRSTSKQMIACFFGINGHVATVALEQRRTVNSEWYTTICLPEVIGEIRKKQKNRRIILHHDNASSHTSTQTKAFLTERKIELMGHPPTEEGGIKFFGFQGKYLEAILQGLKAQFELVVAEDREWGQLLPDGNWTGMIGKIQKDQADIAVFMMTVTELRSDVVDYSPTYTTEDMTFAIEKPGKLPKSLAFVRTFDSYIWIVTLITLIIFPMMYKILLRCKDTYIQVLLMLVTTLLKQPIVEGNGSLRFHLLISSWMIFATIFSFSYSAVFLSLLTVPLDIVGVRNFKELSDAVITKNYACFILKGSSTMEFLLRSEKEYLRNLGQAAVRNGWYVKPVLNPLDTQMDKKSAMIGGRTWLSVTAGPENWKHYYIAEDSLLSFQMAVAMKKNFCLKKRLNRVVASLNNAGLYEKISEDDSFKMWITAPEKRRILIAKETALSLNDLMGVFVVLLSGLGLSLFFFCL
ncbi:glutamate receptor ionotropic, delta-1 [Nephila pilipes]|uniref:Glutamate receptor ionotropic, delta-1 n=1 Tax=Nephila pilipes TaxID=299642 RepID=A0A8X6JAT4_NEPPI|nr:glutamate receptor ionotropic, delta-1 [Nephila pilipes]